MPVISKVGSRHWKVRLVYAAIFGVLIAGSATMIYPFMLMVSGSMKSEADSVYVTPYPRFLFDDATLLQKYAESKYNVQLSDAEAAWWGRIGSWRNILRTDAPEIDSAKDFDNWSGLLRPTPDAPRLLDDYLAWRKDCPWWTLGHTGGGRMLPINARLFRRVMVDRFDGDIDAYRKASKIPLNSWNMVNPPPPPPGRFSPPPEGVVAAFNEFAAGRPLEDRVIPNLDGIYWKTYLVPKYQPKIEKYNNTHGTKHASYRDVWLTRRAPPAGLARRDWEKYVREELRLEFIRLDASLAGAFRRSLAEKYRTVAALNKAYGAEHKSFDDVPFPTGVPERLIEQVDWAAFIRARELCPLGGIEVYGPRQAFEEFVAGRRGIPVTEVAPLAMPVAAADCHDAMRRKGELRWEFSTRNYKHVLEYIFLHGRGILNTVIYCALAIGTALIVNPLAAYALSRYKPPSTYKILLFCMATMAFPNEVTMIPGFLLRKRFPLWPLVGGGVAFGVVLWLATRLRPRGPELLRMTLAVGVGIVVGVWGVPAMIGRPTISLLNTFAALVLPVMANGFFIFLLKGFFDSLPRDLYEAADIDGAGEWTKFWTITMSLSKPILAVIALNAFTAAYSAFMMALIIIPDPKMWTIMVWLFQLQTQSHQGVVYASLVLAAIPTLLVFVFCQNIIIRGIVVPVEK